ncbi:MAG: hypothetical protein P4L53_14650 [Candidatus Obscuribacterales bacterium]|nr:hypothetical protein [Candidatus Obscuribacterales bacterium]
MITRSKLDTYRRIFLFTTIPYGLITGIFVGCFWGIWHGLIAGVGGGLFYGLGMALCLGALQQFSTKQLKTDYRETLLGVHQVQALSVERCFDEAFELCASSVLLLRNCRITQQDKELGIINAQTGTTWKSFGEKIMLTVSSTDKDSCTVTISSKPAISTTLVDYGKNVENLRVIEDALSRRAGTIALPSDSMSGEHNAHSKTVFKPQ